MLDTSRSRYLAPLPPISRPGRAQRIAWRSVLIGVCAALVVAVIAVLVLRPFPRASLAYPIYWAHDALYLRIKGYTYTRYLPVSLVWWSLLALVSVLWLASFLSDRSLILHPHTHLLRWAVRRAAYHGWLLAAAEWFAQIGLAGHALLREVVEHEFALVIGALVAMPRGQANEATCDFAVRLCTLVTRLLLLESRAETIDAARLQAAMRQQQAAIALHYQQQKSLLKRSDELATKLAAPVLAQVQRWRQPPDLSGMSLLIDLFVLACQNVPALVERGLDPEIAARVPSDKALAHFLVEATDRRRGHVERARGALERHAWARASSRRIEPNRDASPLTLPDEHAVLIGELAAGQAILAALVNGEPTPALAFLDALDALGLAADLVLYGAVSTAPPSRDADDPIRRLAVQAHALSEGASTSLHYRVAATLVDEMGQRRRQEQRGARAAAALFASKQGPSARLLDDIAKEDDFELIGACADLLDGAAGPRFADSWARAPSAGEEYGLEHSNSK
jgi:hypothetical protein